MKIESLRKQIDDIDDTIIKLLKSRQDIVDAVANFKAETNFPILDVVREGEIVDRLKKKAIENNIEPSFVENIIKIIMTHSKKHQASKLLSSENKTSQNKSNSSLHLSDSNTDKSGFRIGIIGFGRFGKLLVKNLAVDFDIFVFDINHDKESVIASGGKLLSLEEVCKSDIIIPAVPISEFENIIKQISPLLKKGAIVMDVCSVKEFPVEIMKQHLPENIDIIATHPMFGPDSAADSIKDKKIVVCKVRVNDMRFKTIINLFRHKGLIVIETTPEEHDKQIAMTQVLTHFIGHALIDMGAEAHEIDTEGYKRLLHILGVVCNDTYQLFEDINHQNKYSDEVRKKLISSLKNIDDKLKQSRG
ncbi:prephenate dehydrogenase/arogenate dehydrogenase family protein [Candidatus Woesearchaeota archaeon]|nr:prephenate dehydrogenase/arogenate dehydrogenase family protein [Candidatus Woesearchaeota archaeon]